MELDHVFIFTGSPGETAAALEQFGLTEGPPNTHPGQGTACRRFFFNNAYLELVWVSDEQEIKSPAVAKTMLWQRSQYTLTGYCPFGLCFRNSNNNNALFEGGWKYEPPYMPGDLYINIASNADFPAEPMLFALSFGNTVPKDHQAGRKLPLSHKIGVQEITKLTLTLPLSLNHVSGAMKKVISESTVSVSEGQNFSVALEFDHHRNGEAKSFSNIIPLTIHW